MRKAPKKGTSDPLLPVIERLGAWTRGPAHVDGSYVAMDFSRRENYSPGLTPELLTSLARVRDAKSAVDFVEHFGLLNQGPIYADDEYVEGIPRNLIPAVVSEPLERLRAAGQKFRQILEVYRDFKKALHDELALKRLRNWADQSWPPSDAEILELFGDVTSSWRQAYLLRLKKQRHAASNLHFLSDVELWLTAEISAGLRGTQVTVIGGHRAGLPLGTFRWVMGNATSLLQFAFFHVAQLVMRDQQIEVCDECHNPFVIHDARQRFCGKACGTSARVRKFRQGSPVSGSTRKKGRKNEQATRKG